jgi:hypothetical protein
MDKSALIVFSIFAGIVAVSVLIQACALAAVFFAARKTQQKVHGLVDDMRIHVLPTLSTSRALLEDLSPKIKTIASNLVESSNNLRSMAEDASGVVEDVAGRAHAEAAHVDGMVHGTLDQITHAGSSLQQHLAGSVRQLNGIFNGLRAGFGVMWQKTSPNHDEEDESERDLFI